MRKGQVRSFSEFFWDMVLSVFAGMMVFLAVQGTEYSEYIKALFISMGACMGRETLFIFQKIYRRKIGGGDDP